MWTSNYAYVDTQNVNLSTQNQWRKLDRKKLFVYLKERYKVTKCYLFLGYIPTNQDMYTFFQSIWYILIFKPVLEIQWKTKWNVDAELVLQAMIDYDEYKKAIVITWDGDFACLIKYLYKNNKLEKLVVPDQKKHSVFLKQTAKEKLDSLSNLKKKLWFHTHSDKKKPAWTNK